ncbi:MAG: sulfatase family protein [Chloroflexota bacterium]
MASRPNVLLVMTDQQQSAALSCAGNPEVSTPNLDALAARGTRFASAYTPFPLCTPARAALFSGRMPHALGIMDNNQPIPERYREETLGHLFARAGYDCAYGGKWHVTQIAMEDGFAFRRIAGFNDHLLPPAAIDFLRTPRDRPFLLVASFDNPHNICEHSRNQPLPWGEVPLAPIEECPNLPPNFSAGPYEPEALRAYAERAGKFRRRPGYTADRWRLLRHVYYRLVEKVDAQIGQILAALRSHGQEDHTIVVFTSDHGDMAGAHELNQKHSLYDESARVPLIVAGPGVAAGGVVDEPVSLVDVLPTVCDLAGVDAPEDLPGVALRPALEGRGFERAPVVVQSLWGQEISSAVSTQARCLVTREHKYVVHEWGEYREQLFDRAADPWEQSNLALEARHRPRLRDCRHVLREWCLAAGDRFTRYIHEH